MSKENVRKFYELLVNNLDVADELKNSVVVRGEAEAEKTVAQIIGFAAEKGFDFTGEDLAAFELENQQELTPEELEKINAAGGGYCLGLGFGWNEGYGVGYTKCTAVGKGLGFTWSDTNDLENEEGNRLVKNIVDVVAHATSKIVGK
jgi:predicted ribosomally synthesized peptide with nif11-like leader